jgi:hypothetical protein
MPEEGEKQTHKQVQLRVVMLLSTSNKLKHITGGLRPHYGPGFDSASNQEYFLGG